MVEHQYLLPYNMKILWQKTFATLYMANCYFVIKHSWLPMMDLRRLPVMEVISHEFFAEL